MPRLPTPGNLVAFDHCRHPLPCFTWTGRTEAAAQLHRLALELSRPGTLAASGGTRALASLVYFASGLRQSLRSFGRNAGMARRIHGVPYRRQLSGVLHTVFRRNASPDIYYIHRLFEGSALKRIDLFFEHRELMLLLRALYASLDTDEIAHKVRFHDFCRLNDLPTPPLWAIFRDGKIEADSSARWLADPHADIFVKPASAFAGQGVARWRYEPETMTYVEGARSLSHAGLTDLFTAESREGGELLVQPRLHEGAELADLAAGAVCNFRILTGCAPEAPAQILTASLRLPPPGHYLTDVDNDIFAAPIDVGAGRLATAQAKALRRGIHSHHPVSGAPIAGRMITGWPKIAALAVRAHNACRWMPFVGWDIVDSAHGPTLLEGNAYWGGNLCQMSGHRFLGETAFPEIYRAHIPRLRPDLAKFLQH